MLPGSSGKSYFPIVLPRRDYNFQRSIWSSTTDYLSINFAWAVIVSCKSKKEDRKSLEKKVKAQFSLVPFEDVTPVVEDEPSLETDDEEEIVPVCQTV